ncbi:2Fe-2S ferredoxin-type domain-containing protein [Chaetomium strumarium]|uniref:2Fe-2S ferredoxin-type domain-containing protein n=1 Tax=Chaetomium strumarium TaxID=1170767 RepID=A0AAJ0M4I2_9PEZI|nr:2Fe-2S ferredoxin-type domain-containing protein [Chaetomium strumarium]
MSIPRLLARTVPSLRLARERTGASVARHVRSYTITSAASRSPRPRVRHSPWSTPSQTRSFSASPAVLHGHIDPPKPGEELYVTFIDKEGAEHKFAVSKGDNLLDIAQANDLEMEGACGGSCACSTCHVIVMDQEYYDRMPEPDDDENDMLDLAFGLQETSRLGCQVVMTPELDGLRVKLPAMTRNLQSSDFK